MKKYIVLIAAITFAFPSFAKDKAFDDVNRKIVENIAEKNGWCNQKPKTAKSGQIVIEWVRDKGGKCTKQIVRKIK